MLDPRMRRRLVYLPIADLRPNPRNTRKHSRAQIEAIAASMRHFGFINPILVDRNGMVIAGHGRLAAAVMLGIEEIPVIFLDELSEEEARAYAIADNRLGERSSWDEKELALQLKELSDLALEFDIQVTGFELPEIDLRIASLDPAIPADDADTFEMKSGPAVSAVGDLWALGEHRIRCGSALDGAAYMAMQAEGRASVILTDPPYNVQIDGNVTGSGTRHHREFVMASGEMSDPEFALFLIAAFKLAGMHAQPDALLYSFMDWRHMGAMLAAGNANALKLLNLCVWTKTNGGMGSFYRSQHELVFVFQREAAAPRNNIQLGRFGRNRTNVWNYAGANVRKRKGPEDPLSLHPTVKPIELIADAIRDSTARGDIVLDPFLGSGTAVLAAEKTGRRGFGIELDPLYVDTAIVRWERLTGHEAVLVSSGSTFATVADERLAQHAQG